MHRKSTYVLADKVLFLFYGYSIFYQLVIVTKRDEREMSCEDRGNNSNHKKVGVTYHKSK
jgi:hypothetical protein